LPEERTSRVDDEQEQQDRDRKMALDAAENPVFWGYGDRRKWLFSHDAEVIQKRRGELESWAQHGWRACFLDYCGNALGSSILQPYHPSLRFASVLGDSPRMSSSSDYIFPPWAAGTSSVFFEPAES
jgi:hypothetical protein